MQYIRKKLIPVSDTPKQPAGGTDWELSEAIRLMGEAQASGDPEQIATAMRRHAEALTNAANSTMIPTLKNVLETVLRAEIGQIYARMDNHNAADLDRRTEDRVRLDKQSDYLYRELDEIKAGQAAIPAAVKEAVALEVGKVIPRIVNLEAGQTEITVRISDMGEEVSTVKQDVERLKQDVAEIKIDQLAMHVLINDIRHAMDTDRIELRSWREQLDAGSGSE